MNYENNFPLYLIIEWHKYTIPSINKITPNMVPI